MTEKIINDMAIVVRQYNENEKMISVSLHPWLNLGFVNTNIITNKSEKGDKVAIERISYKRNFLL